MDANLRRQTLADTLRRSAARAPGRIGLACGLTRWTYRELHAVCERLAAGLAARGIRRGDKVAVLARNSHGFVALRYALMRLGAVMVPINFMLQADDVAFILNHSGARMLASDSGMAEVARKGAALAPHVSEFLWLPSEEETSPVEGMTNFHALIETGGEPPGVGPESFDVAQIVYTSGTESRPKGVQLTHDAILWQYVSCMVDAEIAGDDVAVQALPLYHCAQLDVFLGPSIYAGGVNVVTAKPVPDNIFRLVERERATSFFAPPTVWISMLRSPAFDGADLSSLRKGYYGASIMPVEVMREMARRMPKVRLWNLYGQTEIAPLATMLGPEDQLRKPGSCGRARAQCRDARGRRRDARRRTWRGRRDRPSLAASDDRLLQGRGEDGGGLSRRLVPLRRSRDRRRGGIYHRRRPQEGHDQDRRRERREPRGRGGDLRAAGVSEVAVIGAPHPNWIEAVVAVVVPKAGSALDQGQVLEHAHKALAVFKVPKRVVFAEALPKNPSGKILKRQLREEHVAEFG